MRTLFPAFVFLAAWPVAADAQTPVTIANPSFSVPASSTPRGEPARTPATCTSPEVGSSAAESWTTFGNDRTGSIVTWLTVAPDGVPAHLVAAGGPQNGLVQVMAMQNTLTTVNRVSAKAYVLAGEAYVELGNGGSGSGIAGRSTTTRSWELLSACGRPDMLNNQVVVYGTGPAVFYVSDIEVSYDPRCPACSHAPDKPGPPLAASCGACQATVCAADAYCCSVEWDAVCVAEASTLCP